MFNYGNANEAQKEAISATDGLVLITAGPGTGKTFTLVKRAVYLIQECGIKPEQIMMATFTEKAAKELITRITNELAERNVSVNVTLGRVLSVYQEMLEEGNLIDFSTIQTECYKLLMQNKQILEELQDKLQYLMIDEYQDTNYIQEQIVFLLGAKHHNICVVGDDDQGLYRFNR